MIGSAGTSDVPIGTATSAESAPCFVVWRDGSWSESSAGWTERPLTVDQVLDAMAAEQAVRWRRSGPGGSPSPAAARPSGLLRVTGPFVGGINAGHLVVQARGGALLPLTSDDVRLLDAVGTQASVTSVSRRLGRADEDVGAALAALTGAGMVSPLRPVSDGSDAARPAPPGPETESAVGALRARITSIVGRFRTPAEAPASPPGRSPGPATGLAPVLGEVAIYVGVVEDVAPAEIIARLETAVRKEPQRWPLIAWLLERFADHGVPPVGWIDVFVEVRSLVADALGLPPDPALETVLAVQEFLLPDPRRLLPATMTLPHDYAAFRRAAAGGGPFDRLAELPPGTIRLVSESAPEPFAW